MLSCLRSKLAVQRCIIGIILFIGLTACAGRAGVSPAPAAASGKLAAVLTELDATTAPAGVDEQLFNQLKEELKAQLLAKGALKATSAPPTDDASGVPVQFDSGSGTLSWRYYCKGDYDQNGEVNIADLTPIAIHFRETGPFDPATSASCVDGDRNGEINLADISPIAANYSVAVSGYNVYRSTDPGDIPVINSDPNGPGAQAVGTVALADATGDKNADRLAFSLNVPGPVPDETYWVRPTDGTSEGTPFVRGPSSRVLAPGATVNSGSVLVTAPEGSLIETMRVEVNPAPVPPSPPAGFNILGEALDISVSSPELLDAPLIFTMSYDDTGVPDENLILVLHYTAAGIYEPVTLHEVNTAANTVTFDSRNFSILLVGFVDPATIVGLPASHSIAFDPATDGWQIANFGSYFAGGGNCLGMAAYSVWWWENRAAQLWGHYDSSAGAPTSIAHLTAARAHLAQSQYWTYQFHKYQMSVGALATGTLMKYCLETFDTPYVMRMQALNGGHAVVLYGYDAAGFTFYDVNFPGAVQNITWDAVNGFSTYGAYYNYGIVGVPSLGRTEDFADLTAQAEGGFTDSADISLTSPTPDQEISEHEVQLTGSLSGSLTSGVQLLCYVKGVLIPIPVAGSSFDTTIPISNGENTLILIAGVNISAQSQWFKNGATLIRNVKGTAGMADLLVTLTWDQGASDVDLYVTEPGGESSWYSNDETSHGLALDFDNTSGYGPEHVTLSTAEGDTALPGEYAIWVHYYADHGGTDTPTGPVSGKVSILVNEGKPTQQLLSFPFYIGVDNSDNADPGSTGADWEYITSIKILPDPPA